MKQRKSRFIEATGKFYFAHIPHHEEMLADASIVDDAPNAVEQNLADITAMTQAMKAIKSLAHEPAIL